MDEGFIDTNVFIHAQTGDALSEECRRLLDAVRSGEIIAYLEPLVLHELSYALPRYLKQMTRTEVAEYLLMVVRWPGIRCDKELLEKTIQHWWQTPGLAFVDAHLGSLALARSCPVFSKIVDELRAIGVAVPDQLPTTAIAQSVLIAHAANVVLSSRPSARADSRSLGRQPWQHSLRSDHEGRSRFRMN